MGGGGRGWGHFWRGWQPYVSKLGRTFLVLNCRKPGGSEALESRQSRSQAVWTDLEREGGARINNIWKLAESEEVMFVSPFGAVLLLLAFARSLACQSLTADAEVFCRPYVRAWTRQFSATRAPLPRNERRSVALAAHSSSAPPYMAYMLPALMASKVSGGRRGGRERRTGEFTNRLSHVGSVRGVAQTQQHPGSEQRVFCKRPYVRSRGYAKCLSLAPSLCPQQR